MFPSVNYCSLVVVVCGSGGGGGVTTSPHTTITATALYIRKVNEPHAEGYTLIVKHTNTVNLPGDLVGLFMNAHLTSGVKKQ